MLMLLLLPAALFFCPCMYYSKKIKHLEENRIKMRLQVILVAINSARIVVYDVGEN